MFQINKQDLREAFSAIFEDYENHVFQQGNMLFDTMQTFGSVSAIMSEVSDSDRKIRVRQYLLTSTEEHSKIRFIFGLTSTLFSQNAFSFRKELLENETIRGIATLKQKVFKHTVVPSMCIFLDKDMNAQTWLAPVENLDQMIAYVLEDDSVEFKGYYSNHLSPDNLLPEYYNGDDALLSDYFSGTETKKLSDVAEIILGKNARSEEFAETGIPYLRGRDIQARKIMPAEKHIASDSVDRFSRQLLQDGDILMTKNFGQNKLALVTEDDCPAIASGGLFIIRPCSISERYLFGYLTSETGNSIFNKQVNRIQRGTVIRSIAIKDMMELLVPVYERDVMENLENIGQLSVKNAIQTSKKLMNFFQSESDVETHVIDDLHEAGWNDYNESDDWIYINKNLKWHPDLSFIIPDGRTVLVEIKTTLSTVSQAWLDNIRIVLSEDTYILILTTGMLYEVHVPGRRQCLQVMHAPTLQEILSWEKEVC